MSEFGASVKSTAVAVLTLVVSLMLACGGGGGKSSSSGSTSQAGASGPVTVSGGQTLTGVDISVPSGSAPLNALVLGTADISAGGGSASNTGSVVARGTQAQVLMFGPGLNGNLAIVISGPNDITVSNPQTISSTKGTPGVEFVITVSSGAAIGARTVFLSDSNGNTTTFTGGLEVQ